jgi:glycosyltransferase involved in cell wall biosynthesis
MCLSGVVEIQNLKLKTQNSRRVKVAHIITRLELGGAQQNTLYCCAHHDRRKYEVILISGIGGYLDGEARKIKDCKTYFLPELKHPVRPLWDLRALRRITDILRSEKVDLVHTHSSKAGILGRWAAQKAGVPQIVHTVHGWGFYPEQFFLSRWLYRVLERWAARFTDVMITVSEENRQTGLAVDIGQKDQYRVIHSGIDPKAYSLGPSAARKERKLLKTADRPTVLVLSNFKKQKSPLDVIEVAAQLVLKLPQVLFLWAGDGPLLQEAERLIEEKALKSNFVLLGWRDDVGKLLAASDTLLLTSIYEGLPRVVLQAMAAGKPVVATAVSGTPEAVKQGITGYLNPAHDVQGMAENLFKILSNPRLARKMGQAGRNALKGTFLIQKMLREIEKTYEKTPVKPSKAS